jgi:hypothetical protein
LRQIGKKAVASSLLEEIHESPSFVRRELNELLGFVGQFLNFPANYRIGGISEMNSIRVAEELGGDTVHSIFPNQITDRDQRREMTMYGAL